MDKEAKKEVQKEAIRGFYSGMRHGITRFAWWRDGVQYVGTCGMTLKDALQEIKDEEESAIMQIDLEI